MRKTYIVFALLILLSFVIGALLYNVMPDTMASHWNMRGRVDGYTPKFWGLFLMPIISIIMLILFIIIPIIDPMSHNIEEFRKHYDNFALIIGLFFFYIYIITLFWNLGAEFEMNRLLPPAFAIVLAYCGIMLYHAKRNWSIGIKTPWTMSSDYIWDQTHQLGGMMFTVSGAICLLGVILPQYSIIFILVPVLAASLILVLYSYLLYLREQKNKNAKPLPKPNSPARKKPQAKPGKQAKIKALKKPAKPNKPTANNRKKR